MLCVFVKRPLQHYYRATVPIFAVKTALVDAQQL